MQHRISLSKNLLIAIKNKKRKSKPMIKGETVNLTRLRNENLQKKYIRYTALAGLTKMRIEEIY